MKSKKLDWRKAVELAGFTGDEAKSLFEEIGSLYLEAAPPTLAQLREAVKKGDARATQEKSHRLRGMSLQIGAYPLAEVCEALEIHCIEKNARDPKALLVEIEAEFSAVEPLIKKAA